MTVRVATRHLFDAARCATVAAVIRLAPRPTADETVTALSRQAAVSAAAGAAHLVAALAMLCGHTDTGSGDLDGDARGPDEDDAASIAPEGVGLGVVDVRALTADEERLWQAADRSARQRGRHG